MAAQTAHFFRPDLGTFERRLVQVVRGFPGHNAFEYLDAIADDAAATCFGGRAAGNRELRWAFSMSLPAES